VGISRRIADDAERERLREMMVAQRRDGEGFIVRTACEGKDWDVLREDVDYLRRLWRHVDQKIAEAKGPLSIHEDLELGIRSVRDLMSVGTDRVLVNDPELYQRIKDFAEQFLPALADRVQLYDGIEPMFDHYAVELELDRLLGRKVWLKSGGHIVIDQTEALVAVDVNTGRYVGHDTLEETTLRVNLEAVREIVHQLQLRDIGGIIVIDFIDMLEAVHREEVFRALVDELKNDKARTHVLPISEFGLVEMTRKRVREDVVRYLSTTCQYCDGRGYTKSRETVTQEVFNSLRREALKHPADWIVVRCHPEVADQLVDSEREYLMEIEGRYGFRTHVQAMSDTHIERFEVRACPPGEVPG
jgi:ribonuclease G